MSAQLGVSVPKMLTVGKHSRLFRANAPSLWGRYIRNPFRKRGFLWLLSFGTFSLQKQRKVHRTLAEDKKSTQNLFRSKESLKKSL